MLCHLITCNGYKLIRSVTVNSFDELPALCLAEEQRINDGYAVIASYNGSHVANAEYVYQSTACGGLLGYDHACGYHN